MDTARMHLLKGMKELDADLTSVLVAEHRNPDKLIMTGVADSQLHIHE